VDRAAAASDLTAISQDCVIFLGRSWRASSLTPMRDEFLAPFRSRRVLEVEELSSVSYFWEEILDDFLVAT
jgi:hypothetical protein